MKTLTIKDLGVVEQLDREAMAGVHGGMMKLQRVSPAGLLTSPDGEPVVVVVDGLVRNSVTTGYAPR
jgi:hypothetical protein